MEKLNGLIEENMAGWGLAPRKWQGWVYIIVMIGILIFLQNIAWNNSSRTVFTVTWLAVIVIDTFEMMINLKKDEREFKIEAVAERNASWAMVIILTLGFLYDLVRGAMMETIQVNWVIVVTLIGGTIVKGASNYILERKGI